MLNIVCLNFSDLLINNLNCFIKPSQITEISKFLDDKGDELSVEHSLFKRLREFCPVTPKVLIMNMHSLGYIGEKKF